MKYLTNVMSKKATPQSLTIPGSNQVPNSLGGYSWAVDDGMRGWGRGLRAAIAGWYNAMPAEKLAYQAVKYQNRDGWCHRDLLRLAHPKPADSDHLALYKWVTQGLDESLAGPTSPTGST